MLWFPISGLGTRRASDPPHTLYPLSTDIIEKYNSATFPFSRTIVSKTRDRKERLQKFVDWVSQHVRGDEKGEAQIFLDRLFQGFGQPGCLDVGGETEFRVHKSGEDGGGISFADYVWKPIVLIEMKRRGVDLSRHYRQAFDYWTQLVPGRPRYTVLCNFDEFWVYDFDTQMETPVDMLKLADLPDRYGPLAFLFPEPEHPTFGNDLEAVTREAADLLANCFNRLTKRGVERMEAQRFILQMLVALFAEDIGLLDRYIVTNLLDKCKTGKDSYTLIGGLFEEMNKTGKPTAGYFEGVDYFNGGLFSEPARLELYDDETHQLREAAKSDWSKVRPEIFGTLFQHSLDKEEQHAYGGHFTYPVDIMKIVGPTIVRPWTELIENAKTIKELSKLHSRLATLTVLDPACGSGNFLYIAYREMKRLEVRLFERLGEVSKREGKSPQLVGLVTARQFFGIDINPFAVELAKVTMMIARKLAIDELQMSEEALPLDNLDSNIIAADALIDGDGNPVEWPRADVIIGNPPFLDARKMHIEYGEHYVKQLGKTYPDITRRSDLCVYWFRKAHDHLQFCSAVDPVSARAGLVGTQNIRNNEAREGGLDHIVASGTIIEAVDNQPWSGEANVHVSIPNWVKHEPINGGLNEQKKSAIRKQLLIPEKKRLWFKVDPEPGKKKIRKKGTGPAAKEYELAYHDSDLINSALSDQVDVAIANVLTVSRRPKRCFEGQQPGHKGFRIKVGDLPKLKEESAVVFPYLNGTSLLTRGYVRQPEFIIDFGDRNMIEVSEFPIALNIVRERVLPQWQVNAETERRRTGRETGEHQRRLETWWQLKRRRGDLISAVERLSRYVTCSRVTKRPIYTFVSSIVRPDSSLSAFTFEDDYSFGILQSNTHWQWFTAKCSKLTERFRYTPDSVWDTFPWPQSPSVEQIDAVAEAGCEVRRVRGEALEKIKGGLRAVYRTLELPGKNPLKGCPRRSGYGCVGCLWFHGKE